MLFCDLADFTAISASHDPEALLGILDLYQTVCDQVIARHQGYTARYLGDGVLAYFGYPRANEYDAVNAIMAGLELVEAIRTLRVREDVTLKIRVGVATGLVVVSNLMSRGEFREKGVIGETPNLAFRLQSHSRPGKVTIAGSTWRLSRGLFRGRDLGALALKGFPKPVQAWEVLEAKPLESRSRPRSFEEAGLFVGREVEIEVLLERWDRACNGLGQVVFLSGEPGIGKSCLVDALAHRLAYRPHLRMRWFCSPHHSDRPLHPLTEQMERAAGFARGDAPAAKLMKLKMLLAQTRKPDENLLALLAGLFSIPPEHTFPIDDTTPEKRKEVTLTSLLAWIKQLSDVQPVLIVVEDVHWIDATSLEFLDVVVRRLRELRILIVITCRPEFRIRWTDLPGVTAVALGRLDDRCAQEICNHIAGARLSSDVLHQIVARCDGVPLFVEELTKAVVESSAVTNGFGTEPIGGSVSIPLSLHDSLVARLDRLGPSRQIANIGAVVGRTFHYDLLAAVASLADADLRSALNQLTRSGLVRRTGAPPASHYVFKHALIRDAAYESLLRSDRQRLHGEIASVLQSRFPDLAAGAPELLAYHLTQSGAAAEAIPLWEQAGLSAASRAAHVEAVGHYKAALGLSELLPESDKAARRLILLIRLARSLSSSQGYAVQEVRDILMEARILCDHLGNPAELFPVMRGLCTFSIVSNDLLVAEELAQRCLQISQQTQRPEHRIEADTPLGYILVGRGEFQRGQWHLEEALRVYAEKGGRNLAFSTEQDPKVACLSLLAIVQHLRGAPAEAERSSRHALSHARSLKRPFDLAYALCFASEYESIRGNYARAKRLAEEAMSPCEKHGFGVWLDAARLNLAVAIGHLGEVERGLGLLEPTLERWGRAGCRYLATYHMGQLAELHAASGRLEPALSAIDAAIDQAVTANDMFYRSALHRIRADILARLPGSDRACVEAELRQAVSVARAQGAATLEAQASARMWDIWRGPD